MSKKEWVSAVVGALFLGWAIVLVRDRKMEQPSLHPKSDTPVDVLADRLKEAWSEHHTEA